MGKLRQLIVLAAMVMSVAAVNAQDSGLKQDEPEGRCLRTDRIWEYYFDEWPGTASMTWLIKNNLAKYRFIRHDYYEGKRYEVFRMISRRRFFQVGYDRDTQKILYGEEENPPLDYTEYCMREEDGKVYFLVHPKGSMGSNRDIPEGFLEEIMVYDFNLEDGETILKSVDPKMARVDWLMDVPVKSGEPIEIEGEMCRVMGFGDDTSYHDIDVIEGIGPIRQGILPLIYENYETVFKDFVYPTLSRVYNDEGEVVYTSPWPWEESVGAEIEISLGVDDVRFDGYRSPETRIFDLQGRELTAPVPGQPYIKGGKVLVGSGR